MSTGSRHADPTDRDAMVETLLEGFRHDPLMALMLPSPEAGRADDERLRRMMENEVDRHLPAGHSYIVDERAVALWTPPGIDAPDEEFSALVTELAGEERMGELIPNFIEMMQWKPPTPHFYLHMIAGRDDARGQGLGSVLLSRVLDVCDAEQTPAYLEASTARSAALYERHGFRELAVIRFTDDVALHPMIRDPA
jgi:GNAT superfamily N-acetyltransferase